MTIHTYQPIAVRPIGSSSLRVFRKTDGNLVGTLGGRAVELKGLPTILASQKIPQCQHLLAPSQSTLFLKGRTVEILPKGFGGGACFSKSPYEVKRGDNSITATPKGKTTTVYSSKKDVNWNPKKDPLLRALED